MRINRRSEAVKDIDVTPFMSLMVVLIPILLVSAKFSIFAEYHIDSAPSKGGGGYQQEATESLLIKVDTQKIVLILEGETPATLLTVNNREPNEALALLEVFFQKWDKMASVEIHLPGNYAYKGLVQVLDVVNQHKAQFGSVSVKVIDKDK